MLEAGGDTTHQRGGWGSLIFALCCGLALGGIMLAMFLWVGREYPGAKTPPTPPASTAAAPPR